MQNICCEGSGIRSIPIYLSLIPDNEIGVMLYYQPMYSGVYKGKKEWRKTLPNKVSELFSILIRDVSECIKEWGGELPNNSTWLSYSINTHI